MYTWIEYNLTGMTMIVSGIGMLVVYGKLGDRSPWVKAHGFSFGILIFNVLLLDGYSNTDQQLVAFIEQEWLRFVFIGGIALGLASIAIRAAEIIYRSYQFVANWNQRRVEMRQYAESQTRRRLEEEEIRENVRREHEARRPEMEREAAAKWERQREANAKAAADAVRRENARRECLLVYHRYAGKVSDSLSWERFSDYLNRFMGDSVSPEVVETCGKEMRNMILSFFETKPAREKSAYQSLTDLVADYQARRSEIEQLPIDEIDRAAQLAHLAREESRAIRMFNSK